MWRGSNVLAAAAVRSTTRVYKCKLTYIRCMILGPQMGSHIWGQIAPIGCLGALVTTPKVFTCRSNHVIAPVGSPSLGDARHDVAPLPG